jgi:hypothetical protein
MRRNDPLLPLGSLLLLHCVPSASMYPFFYLHFDIFMFAEDLHVAEDDDAWYQG